MLIGVNYTFYYLEIMLASTPDTSFIFKDVLNTTVTHSVQKDSRGLLSLDGRYSRRDRRPSSTVD